MSKKQTESGWLIEAGSSPPKWWDGHGVDRVSFTTDPNNAVRFARECDAEIVRCWLLEQFNDFTKSTDHQWLDK